MIIAKRKKFGAAALAVIEWIALLSGTYFLTKVGFSDGYKIIVGMIWTMVLSLILIHTVGYMELDRISINIFAISYALHLAIIILNNLFPYKIIPGGDASLSSRQAVEAYYNGTPMYFTYGRIMYRFFHIVGGNVYLVCLVQLFIFSLACILFLRMMEECALDASIRIPLLLFFMLNPYIIWFISTPLREVYYISGAVTVIYFTKRFMESRNLLWVVLAVPVMAVMAYFHEGFYGVIVAYPVFLILYYLYMKRYVFKPNMVMLILLGVLCVFLLSLLFSPTRLYLMEKIGLQTGYLAKINELYEKWYAIVSGGSDFLPYFPIADEFQMVLRTPIRLLFFAFAPMPTDWYRGVDVIMFATDSLIHIFALCFGGSYIYKSLEIKEVTKDTFLVVLILFIYIFVSLIFAWGAKNAANSLRHRSYRIALDMIMIAISLGRKSGRSIKGETEQ